MTSQPAPRPTTAEPYELTDRDQAMLAFEGQWWRYAGAKEQAIRATFDMSATRYYQLLGVLVGRPEALAHSPMTVKRLRRLRDQRRAARAGVVS